jgi:hypothetical protein
MTNLENNKNSIHVKYYAVKEKYTQTFIVNTTPALIIKKYHYKT